MNKKILLWTVLILGVSGCASTETKPKETLTNCGSVDWFEKGRADAMAGEEFTKIDQYTADCKLENVTPKDKVYFSGYLKGIETYCTYDRGYHVGSKGGGSDRGCGKTQVYMDGFTKGQAEITEKMEQAKIERLTRPTSTTNVGAHPESVSGSSAP